MSSQTVISKTEPLIRTVKRAELSKNRIFLLRIVALVLAIVAGGLFLLCIGYNPFQVYGTIIYGAFRSGMAIQATVKIMIPLLITSLGVALAFKMQFWNIGAEGQIIMGAIFATYFALFHADWPHWLLLAVMFLAGMAGGGLWALLPAVFKVKFNTNETLFTLMLNYIALNLIVFFRDGPWADPQSGGFPKIATFDANAQLNKVFGVQAGWIIGLVLVVVVYIYLRYTKQGYEISVVGISKPTARYAGMNVKKIVLRTMFASGAICGIAGMVQAAGSDATLATGVAGGVGFTAIIVAWLGQLNPVSILVVTALFSILEKGSSVVESSMGLSADCSDVLQGIILFFVLGCEFFIRYRFVTRKKGGANK
ncbi:ABC transporter permease [Diplocloster agilis]|uniref:ABC transporter permease n=1 Tax=Diplocloster agilis TaxID=2850323 RepID=UPI001EE7CC31